MFIRGISPSRAFLSGLATAVLLAASAGAHAQDSLHAWTGGADPVALETWVNARVAAAKVDIDKVTEAHAEHTVANTVRPYDDALNELALARSAANLMYNVGDSASLRDKGQALAVQVSAVSTDLSLNQAVYRALAAVPPPANDPATKYYLERRLLQYRLAGVDKDDATRRRIRQLQGKITEQSLVFGRNIADGKLEMKATKADLDGLPEVYISRH